MIYYNINSSDDVFKLLSVDITTDISKHYKNDYDVLSHFSIFYQKSWINEISFKLMIYSIYIRCLSIKYGDIDYKLFSSNFKYYFDMMKNEDDKNNINSHFKHYKNKFNSLRQLKYNTPVVVIYPFINIHLLFIEKDI